MIRHNLCKPTGYLQKGMAEQMQSKQGPDKKWSAVAPCPSLQQRDPRRFLSPLVASSISISFPLICVLELQNLLVSVLDPVLHLFTIYFYFFVTYSIRSFFVLFLLFMVTISFLLGKNIYRFLPPQDKIFIRVNPYYCRG